MVAGSLCPNRAKEGATCLVSIKRAEWRRRMIAAGIRQPSSLDELENHLREHVEQLTREGKTDEEAFDAAVERIGQIDLLTSEFAKAEGFLG